MTNKENAVVRPSFKSGDRVICIRCSKDCYLDREAGNAICNPALLYHVDNVVWSEKLGWLLSISNELHKADDFIHESIIGDGYRLLEEDEVTLDTDERAYLVEGLLKFSWCTLPNANSSIIGIRLSNVRAITDKYHSQPWEYIIVRRKIEPVKIPVKVKLWVRESDGMVIQAGRMPEGFSELVFTPNGEVFKLT